MAHGDGIAATEQHLGHMSQGVTQTSKQTATMKFISTLLLSAALASSALAGTSAAYSGKMVQPMAPTGCDCFAPGAAFGVFGGGIFPEDDGEDAAGGGVLYDYFFTEYFGFQGSYGLFATSSEHHQVRRQPRSACPDPKPLHRAIPYGWRGDERQR